MSAGLSRLHHWLWYFAAETGTGQHSVLQHRGHLWVQQVTHTLRHCHASKYLIHFHQPYPSSSGGLTNLFVVPECIGAKTIKAESLYTAKHNPHNFKALYLYWWLHMIHETRWPSVRKRHLLENAIEYLSNRSVFFCQKAAWRKAFKINFSHLHNVGRNCLFWHTALVFHLFKRKHHMDDFLVWKISCGRHSLAKRDKLVVETVREHWARHYHCQLCGFDSHWGPSMMRKCSVGVLGGWKRAAAAAVEFIWPNKSLQILQSWNLKSSSTLPHTLMESAYFCVMLVCVRNCSSQDAQMQQRSPVSCSRFVLYII